jgi:transposase
MKSFSRPRGRPSKIFQLNPSERQQLRFISRSSTSASAQKRALALLALERGESIDRIAAFLNVTRQSVSNWRDIWKHRRSQKGASLSDQERTGRPSEWTEDRQAILEALLDRSPDEFGYRARSWTSHLLSNHLSQSLGWGPSGRSVRRELKQLGYVYKRPRYVLEPDPQLTKKKP